MSFQEANRLAFDCEWFKEEAMVIQPFLFVYYPAENSGELYDAKTQKKFLRKTRLNLTRDSFFIGSKLDIFGRQIEIVGFADEFTKKLLGKSRQRVFVLIGSSIISKLGNVFRAFETSGFSFTKGMMIKFTEQTASVLFGEKMRANAEMRSLVNQMASNPVIGIEMFADNAFEKLKNSFDRNDKNKKDKGSNPLAPHLELLFKDETIKKGIFFSKTEVDATDEIKQFFALDVNELSTAVLQNTVLGIIKPHIVKDGRVGECVNDILDQGFKITALKIMPIHRVNCEEFLEIYRGVSKEYMQMVAELASGSCICIEVQKGETDIHDEFRQFCGPKDPDIAKQLRPNTLRAKYGKNKVFNAVHVTDLPDDVVLELQYIFKIL